MRPPALAWEQALLVKTNPTVATSSVARVLDGAAGVGHLEALGEEVRPLGHPHARRRHWRRHRWRAGAPSRGVADEEDQRADAAQRRTRSRAAAPSTSARRTGTRRRPAGRRCRRARPPRRRSRRRPPGGGSTRPSCRPEPAGVPDEVDGGEVGDDGDGQHAAEHRGRVDPARPRVTGLPPAGTRPEAMPPAMAPCSTARARTSANAAPKFRRSQVRNTVLRNAKLDPRSTMPRAARVKRDEQRQRDRRVGLWEAGPQHDEEKISHTWLASHTGADRVVDHLAGRSPAAPPATRSQNPAPKSAPPKTAYAVTARTAAARRPRCSCRHPSARRPGAMSARGRTARRGRSTVRSRNRRLILRRMSTVVTASPSTEHDDGDERDPHAGVGGRRVLDLHQVVDDPGLPADLADDPAGLHREHAAIPAHRRQRRNHRLFGMSRRNNQHSRTRADSRNSRVPRPTITSHARWTMLTCGASAARPPGRVEALHHRARARARVRQPRRQARDRDPAADRAVGVEAAEQRLGDVARGLGHQLDGGELHRLVVVDPAGERVADPHLDRAIAATREGDEEAESVVAVRRPRSIPNA